jgi:pimeloyl-ACP methyl ester carboxylesterase
VPTPFSVDGITGVRHGDPAAPAVVFHNGTPTAAMLLPEVIAAAERHGLQALSYSRPGYETSPRRAGRTVADMASVTESVIGDAPWFVAVGWSGGGPHALGDVALAPRCRGAATIAGVGPYDAPFDFLAGMAPENVEEFTAAAGDPDALRAFLDQFASVLSGIDAGSVAESLGELASDVDKAALSGAFADAMADAMRRAVSTGTDGWFDDDIAFVTPWGFDVAAIAKPVAVWQGDQDRMVPFAHGEWLASAIPTATAHLLPGEGHITLGVTKVGEIVDDVVRLAG